MSDQQRYDDTTECGLHSFERNRFFHGKLMTARDMEAEQRYHRNRLRTLAEHVTGAGIVCGLETTVEADDGSLEVTIDAGLAIDSCGHPIVVESQTTEEIDIDELESDPTSLYIDYSDCVKETVPVPGSEDACGEECTYNRVLEIFELAHEPGPPPSDLKAVDTIEFPEKGDFDSTGDARDPDSIAAEDDALRQIATSFGQTAGGRLRGCDADGDHRVFLGRFGTASGDDESWSRVTDENLETPPRVYTNEMLYAAIARHAARFDDPHDVTAGQAGALESVEGVSNPGGDVALNSSDGSVSVEADDSANSVDLTVADRLQEQLSDLGDRVEELEQGLSAMQRELLKSTLHHKRLSFQLLSERFGVQSAEKVLDHTSTAIEDDVHEDIEAYLQFAEEVLEDEQAVLDELAAIDAVPDAALAQYAEAVEELEAVLETADDLPERELANRVAHAQGLVAETAEWIDVATETEEPPEDPQFTAGVYSIEEGGTAEITLSTGDAPELEIQIGEQTEDNYELLGRIDLTGQPYSELTLEFDTAVAGDSDEDALTVQEDVDLEIIEEATLDGTLDVSTYDLFLSVVADGGPRQVDLATLRVTASDDSQPNLESLEDSLENKAAAFNRVAGTINLEGASEIETMSEEAVENEIFASAEKYGNFIAEVAELERQMVTELVDSERATDESLGTYAAAVKRLGNAVENEANVQTLKSEQNGVSEAAGGLQRREEGTEIQPPIDVGSYTIDELEPIVSSDINELRDAQLTLAVEMANDGRRRAELLLLERIEDLRT
ncbi:hypothetical protein Har1130_17760 [Haloarcula sp. CBA1130]|uniref:hypothetical protein n=1 Tax=unclassified Haloarcula TaxID=2624677 RepID=UPI001247ADCD|nr:MULTISPECIES: hypothetical protein [unclassified Haloarcula]KAA9396505.1 hypothetical protein Har1130_17760 [Haloarcula sp. CBA1130]KAA9397638.1 hypothetical protein Har1129_05045 [Haloarcula sp. CBA1129]